MDVNVRNMLLAFFIGSSWISFFMWFIGFHWYSDKFNVNNYVTKITNKNPYFIYTIVAPLYIGFMSLLAVAISTYCKISYRMGFLIVSFISPTIVYNVIKKFQVYNFTEKRYREQYLRLLLYHFLLYNVVIANIYGMMIH
jgi:hypothetical protein